MRADSTHTGPRRIEIAGGGILLLDEAWLAPAEAEALFLTFRDGVSWEQRSIRIAGKSVLEPRLTAWFGDPEASYTYSGVTLAPRPWTGELASLRQRVEAAAGVRFNSVLVNYYRSGADSMGYHADAEKELGPDPVIASLSLGAPRGFVLKYVGRGAAAVPSVSLDLGGGALLVMAGTTQRFWRHAVLKRRGDVGARINLTWRRIVPLPDAASWSSSAFRSKKVE